MRRFLEVQGKWLYCKNSRRRHKFEKMGDRVVKVHDAEEKRQLVVPVNLRTVIKLAQDFIRTGYQGVRKTTNRVAEQFFWPYMQSDVKRFVRSLMMMISGFKWRKGQLVAKVRQAMEQET